MERKVSGILRTRSANTLPQKATADSLIALRYEESALGKPPIPVTVAPPRVPPTDLHPALRRPITGIDEQEEGKRDSGLTATTSSKAWEGSVNSLLAMSEDAANTLGMNINFNSPSQTMSSTPPTQQTALPQLVESQSSTSSISRWQRPKSKNGSAKGKDSLDGEDVFSITTPIPTDSLLEEDFMSKLSFSKRGSMMVAGKKAVNGQARLNGGRR
jgi:hypothetical protein